MPAVSVIIPIYNVEKYLRECLTSLERQSLKDCEFLCIDDGSQDHSGTIAEEFVNRDPRFHFIRQENQGLAKTRNVGICRAEGAYLAFLDSDDFYAKNDTLEILYQKAKSDNLEILSFETELKYEKHMKETENKDAYYYKKYTYDGIRSGPDFFVDMMSKGEYCDSACFLLVKRDWLLKSNIAFYPGILYEDALFSLQCFLKAKRMAHLQERLYTYRIRAKSIMTTQVSWKNVFSRLVVYREILQLLMMAHDEKPLLQQCIADYLSMVYEHVKWMDEFRFDEQPDTVLAPLDQLLLRSLEMGKYRPKVNERVILAGLEKLISDSEGVILYGAGEVGKLLFAFVKDKGLCGQIVCFAMSSCPEAGTSMEGILMLPIEEAVKKRGQIIISAVSRTAQEEMQKTLLHLGVRQFDLCDRYIHRALRHYFQKNRTGNSEKDERK